MRRRPVQSEAVNSIGYGRMTLEVEFHYGRVYQYFPVPEVTYRELIGAESIGNFVATRIKPHFRVRRLQTPTAQALSAGSPSSARRSRSRAGP